MNPKIYIDRYIVDGLAEQIGIAMRHAKDKAGLRIIPPCAFGRTNHPTLGIEVDNLSALPMIAVSVLQIITNSPVEIIEDGAMYAEININFDQSEKQDPSKED